MKPFFRSLRFKIALGMIVPVVIALLILSWVHYLRERRVLESQLQSTASQLGEVMLGSLHHAMQTNNTEMAAHILEDVGNLENVDRVQLLDMEGMVILDSLNENQGSRRLVDEPGCIECHSVPADVMPRAAAIHGTSNILRIETPVFKMPECMDCHAEAEPYLGILLMDVSLGAVQQHVQGDLYITLIISLVGVLILAISIYFLMDWLIVRRVEAFRGPLKEFSLGDLSARITGKYIFDDELTDLVNAFNQMADRLEFYDHEQEERSKVRQHAIMEERERIARELHDGFAQLPVYVNTKAGAVRFMLEKGQLDTAKLYLSQLEDAARELSDEVREAIISLRLSAQVGAGLKNGLQSYVDQLSRLSRLQIVLDISPDIDNDLLDPETELQLFRIAQEALTNVRKHSGASQVKVSLYCTDDILRLVVSDNGKGFDQERTRPRGQSGFGIQNMSERAQAIGAELFYEPKPEGGTRLMVTLNLKKG